MSATYKKRSIEHIFKAHKCITENFKDLISDYYHLKRMTLDPLIFNFLREKYLPALRDYWNTCIIPVQSERAICIVERRCHSNFEFCLLNAVYFARGYSVYIFCSNDNFEFIQSICSPHLNTVHIIQIFDGFGTPEQGKIEYNNLLMKKSFWESIDADYVLTFETDTYLLDFIPDCISEFDYIASKWSWDLDAPGGGGLSFRNKSMMVHLCSDPDLHDQMQDSFVSNGVKKHGYKYPNPHISKQFFIESDLESYPIGVHQWWTFLTHDISLSYIVIEKLTNLNIETS
jgi:hypothetical protein